MKKSSLTGWKDVFSFTLAQTIKSKSYLVSFLIMLIIAIGVMPIISMINNDEEPKKSYIEKVYVNDESKLSDSGFLPTIEDENYQHIQFVTLNEDYDALLKRIDQEETTSVVLNITYNPIGEYKLHFTKSSNGQVSKNETKMLGNLVQESFHTYVMDATAVTEDQLKFIYSETLTKVTATDVEGNEVIKEDTRISQAQYWFIYGLFFFILMIINTSSSLIATSIASDKSTRVVEYLLITVKPLALMIGKILAMLVAVIGQMSVLIICVVLSNQVTASVFSSGGESLLEKYLPSSIFASLNILNIIICLVVIALGLTFCGTLAGLAGATVSKLEELNEGMTLFMVVNMVGAYIGLGAAVALMGSGMNAYVIFALLFPISSPYILPGAILIGNVSLPIAAGAIVLQMIATVLLLRFVANVYETLILHNGNTISFKALIKIWKSLKKEAK